MKLPDESSESTVTKQQRDAADKQIKLLQAEVKYDIRDFVVDYIVDKFREEFFYIPEYQREFIWQDHHRRRFIESVLLGLPIPMMFLATIEEDGRLEIVDGAQRIQTLESFLSNDLELRGLERLTLLNGFRFRDLSTSQQNKLKTKALRLVVLDETTTFTTRKEIFDRINSSGEKARPSEIRRGAYAGPFMTFIEQCAKDSLFRKLCPISKGYVKRREPEELVLRFFAYSDQYLSFQHDVDKFLSLYLKDRQKNFDKKRLKAEFNKTMRFVDKHFPHGFAKTAMAKTTPRVRFESIAVGVNLALRESPDLHPTSFNWLVSPEFGTHTTTHATNSRPRVRGRIEFVRDQLLEAR